MSPYELIGHWAAYEWAAVGSGVYPRTNQFPLNAETWLAQTL